jgi:nucleotide-binding universal stress UspA family protein
MFQRILVAVDQSEIGELAFNTGLNLAKTMKSQMLLVHVIAPTAPGYLNPVYPVPDAIYSGGYAIQMEDYKKAWDVVEQAASRLLQAFQDQANAAGVTTEVSRPISDPAHAICQMATRWNADLIIVGRHHRSRVGEMFWGSVSNFVVHHADCFVLLTQGKADTSEAH